MGFTDRTRVVISPHVRYTRVEGDFVLMDMRSGKYLGLDPVASTIWQSLSEHGDLARAAETVCESFDVELERARADIEAWIDELADKGLLERRTSEPPDS